MTDSALVFMEKIGEIPKEAQQVSLFVEVIQ